MENVFRKYFIVILHLICVHSCTDHYWKDYDGRIPSDAILAGHNNNTNCTLYIGQAYIHHYGLLLGTMIPGSMENHVPCYGVVKTKVVIKILCAREPSKYVWLKTNTTTFKVDMEGKMPVLGGFDRKSWEINGSEGTLNVGRVVEEGRAIIGNIAAYRNDDVWFFYPWKEKEERALNYEVLVYRDASKKLILI